MAPSDWRVINNSRVRPARPTGTVTASPVNPSSFTPMSMDTMSPFTSAAFATESRDHFRVHRRTGSLKLIPNAGTAPPSRTNCSASVQVRGGHTAPRRLRVFPESAPPTDWRPASA